MSPPNPAVPNRTTPLQPPMRHLPIGKRKKDPGGGITYWNLWVPTNTGGQLLVTHGGGAELTLEAPLGTVLVSGKGRLDHFVTTGVFGDFFVTAKGGAGALDASFVQTSWARDVDTPLVPWHFYFWPTMRGSDPAKDAIEILRRYVFATGRSAADADSAEAYERKVHQKEVDPKTEQLDWEGHCHFAAPASALFERFPPTTVIGTVPFSRAEMQYLAAEYFGGSGILSDVWRLTDADMAPLPPKDWTWPVYLKPSDASPEAVVKALADQHVRLDDAVQLVGRERSEGYMRKVWGRLAATFYQALIKSMRVDGHALIANMRDYSGTLGPDPTWNQAIFYYSATYESATYDTMGDLEDPKDVRVTCEIYTNADDPAVLEKLPVHVNENGVVESGIVKPNASAQNYSNEWRLVFDGSGEIVPGDPRCDWIHIRTGAGGFGYAPTELLVLEPPTPMPHLPHYDPRHPERMDMGNPFVREEFLRYAKLRRRYRR